jgi:hypothetical protein
MFNKIAAAAALGLLVAPLTAHAVVIDGSFAGTMDFGTDTTGVFGTPGADLTGDAVAGTFSYDTDLLSSSISGTVNDATGIPGAVTATITILGSTYTFTDPTSSGVNLDTSASEITVSNGNFVGTNNETFSIDALDLTNPFITSTDVMAQNFADAAATLFGSGSFSIADGSTPIAAGAFVLSSIDAAPGSVMEPASMAMMLVGVLGLAAIRKRSAGSDRSSSC